MRGSVVLIMFIWTYLLIECNYGQNKHKSSNINNVKVMNLTINDWQKDKEGCLKLRTKVLAEKLIIEHELYEKGKNDFLKIFGQPNEIRQNEKQLILIYYFDTVCQDGRIQKNGDKCYANFYFNNNKLIMREYLCE
ncbi:MAG: hypothetical protein KatS3mg035_2222 [Bacteroidia bacterium]|nr:MAG: hypothetical protein KatS3mg035_2217 [Bacteroidia bacterium]GIV45099.1 MAG: hypothetical protein KatS3mg035_2222 [Bacteroidia bacterium]